ncbi:MAG: hypothetical protein MRY79_08545 [Alphaproteobacteria bacterium]|nr:hypothetical protein [Alphaproteobacteria bacterium]
MALQFSYPDVSWHPDFDNHEIVLQAQDPDIGFKSFIAVHDTTFGPARGGCRYWSHYQDDNEALKDVLRLSQGMTYKNTMANLPYGGGKAVIMGPKGTQNPSPEIMRALGHALNELDGIYQTGEDVGTRTSDFKIAGEVTEHVRTRSVERAGAIDLPGGPPLYTAHGVYAGIKAATLHKHGSEDLKDVRIAVKGLGNVAWTLCELLVQDGADLTVTDIDQDKLNRAKEVWNVNTSTPDNIIFEDVDIYSPCALGGDINDQTIDKIKAGIIAGAANNQLTDVKKHGQALHDAGIAHAPDYVINAGGVINVVLVGKSHEYVMTRTQNIGNTLINIFNRSKIENKNTTEIANMMVKERLEEAMDEEGTAQKCA